MAPGWGGMFIRTLSAVDYSSFKSRDYSGENPLPPPAADWICIKEPPPLLPCNFRCTRNSRHRQGRPKRRTWGDGNPGNPRIVRSSGSLGVARTLWPIHLFEQNSSSLHVQREEVCKLQKPLKSRLTDKLQIPSCYQDRFCLGLLKSPGVVLSKRLLLKPWIPRNDTKGNRDTARV